MSDIILNSCAGRKNFSFVLPPEAPLTWASFGIEQGALWFMGRSAFALRCDRNPFGGHVKFSVFPLVPTGKFEYSNAVLMSTLVNKKVYPQRLVSPWKPMETQENQTVLNLPMKVEFINNTLGFVAYGFSDLVVDFFKRGAHTVCAQFSVERLQYRADIGMNESEVLHLMDTNNPDYEMHDTVSILQ